jgi:hypothetical protein
MVRPLLAHPGENKEKPKQATGDEQKQKEKRRGAKRSTPLTYLFPTSALLNQLQLK